MKIKQNLLLTIAAFFVINSQAQNNSITITETELKGGGQEFAIKGKPDVITKTKFGTIISNESQMILLKNNKFTRYSGAVNFELKNLKLVIEAIEMTDRGDGTFSFNSGISIRNYGDLKIDTVATFSCENGKVTQDGESTSRSSITYRGVLTTSCSPSNILTVTPKQF